jgi:hypothetical protein
MHACPYALFTSAWTPAQPGLDRGAALEAAETLPGGQQGLSPGVPSVPSSPTDALDPNGLPPSTSAAPTFSIQALRSHRRQRSHRPHRAAGRDRAASAPGTVPRARYGTPCRDAPTVPTGGAVDGGCCVRVRRDRDGVKAGARRPPCDWCVPPARTSARQYSLWRSVGCRVQGRSTSMPPGRGRQRRE